MDSNPQPIITNNDRTSFIEYGCVHLIFHLFFSSCGLWSKQLQMTSASRVDRGQVFVFFDPERSKVTRLDPFQVLMELETVTWLTHVTGHAHANWSTLGDKRRSKGNVITKQHQSGSSAANSSSLNIRKQLMDTWKQPELWTTKEGKECYKYKIQLQKRQTDIQTERDERQKIKADFMREPESLYIIK